MRPRIAGGGFVALALAVALSPVAAPLPVRAADVVAPAALAATERAPELCLVCRVREGATHAEEVRAVVAHEGRDYGLCSAACAKEFATDPVAYLPPVLPRPVPVPDLALTDLAGAPVTWERPDGSRTPAVRALEASFFGSSARSGSRESCSVAGAVIRVRTACRRARCS